MESFPRSLLVVEAGHLLLELCKNVGSALAGGIDALALHVLQQGVEEAAELGVQGFQLLNGLELLWCILQC